MDSFDDAVAGFVSRILESADQFHECFLLNLFADFVSLFLVHVDGFWFDLIEPAQFII